MNLVQELRAKLERIIRGTGFDIYEGLSPTCLVFLLNIKTIFNGNYDWRIRKLTKAIRKAVTGEE